MKKISKNVLKATLAFSLVFFLSCSKEEAAKAMGCDVADLTKQSQEIAKIAIEYQKNATSENCKKYKEAVQKFTKGVESCKSAIGTGAFDENVKELKKEMEGLDCK